jgi:hypothetical protein
MNYFETIIQILVNYVLIPVILAIIPVVLLKLENYVKALIVSYTEKAENESNAAINEVIVNALSQLETIVTAAVSANMTFADKFKEASVDGKLTEKEIIELQDLAKQLIYDTLPVSFKTGNLVEIIGGQEALDKLIGAMVEKALIEIKNKR